MKYIEIIKVNFTDADAALASSGKRPPHALHKTSDIWDIICTTLAQN